MLRKIGVFLGKEGLRELASLPLGFILRGALSVIGIPCLLFIADHIDWPLAALMGAGAILGIVVVIAGAMQERELLKRIAEERERTHDQAVRIDEHWVHHRELDEQVLDLLETTSYDPLQREDSS